jgi:hypothetical protein
MEIRMIRNGTAVLIVALAFAATALGQAPAKNAHGF